VSQAAPAKVGQRLEEVDTPALILDLSSFEKNQQALFDSVKGRKIRVTWKVTAGWVMNSVSAALVKETCFATAWNT
jgi:hypothetical protein